MYMLTILFMFSRIFPVALLICAVIEDEIRYPLSHLFNSSEYLHSVVDALIHTKELNETNPVCLVIFTFQQTPTEKVSFQLAMEVRPTHDSSTLQSIKSETIFIFDRWERPIIQTRFQFVCQVPPMLCNRLLFDYLIDSETYRQFLTVKYSDSSVQTYRDIVRRHPNRDDNTPINCYHEGKSKLCSGQLCAGYALVDTAETIVSRCEKFESEFPLLEYKLKLEITTNVLGSSSNPECNVGRIVSSFFRPPSKKIAS